jgi:hypothetical protein
MPPNVSSTEEIDEIESVNREKLDNKMKDPKCIKNVPISNLIITMNRID